MQACIGEPSAAVLPLSCRIPRTHPAWLNRANEWSLPAGEAAHSHGQDRASERSRGAEARRHRLRRLALPAMRRAARARSWLGKLCGPVSSTCARDVLVLLYQTNSHHPNNRDTIPTERNHAPQLPPPIRTSIRTCDATPRTSTLAHHHHLRSATRRVSSSGIVQSEQQRKQVRVHLLWIAASTQTHTTRPADHVSQSLRATYRPAHSIRLHLVPGSLAGRWLLLERPTTLPQRLPQTFRASASPQDHCYKACESRGEAHRLATLLPGVLVHTRRQSRLPWPDTSCPYPWVAFRQGSRMSSRCPSSGRRTSNRSPCPEPSTAGVQPKGPAFSFFVLFWLAWV